MLDTTLQHIYNAYSTASTGSVALSGVDMGYWQTNSVSASGNDYITYRQVISNPHQMDMSRKRFDETIIQFDVWTTDDTINITLMEALIKIYDDLVIPTGISIDRTLYRGPQQDPDGGWRGTLQYKVYTQEA